MLGGGRRRVFSPGVLLDPGSLMVASLVPVQVSSLSNTCPVVEETTINGKAILGGPCNKPSAIVVDGSILPLVLPDEFRYVLQGLQVMSTESASTCAAGAGRKR
jgi:hypothetical protein